MAISIIFILLLAVFAVSFRGSARSGASEGLGTAVRRFFQYAVQFALVCIVASGLSLLIGRLLQRDVIVLGDRDVLAQGLALTIVGVPFLWLMVRWSIRRFASSPREAQSVQWSWYLSLAELVPLTVFTLSFQSVLLWVVGSDPYDASAIGRSLVWGAAWGVHRRVTRLTTAPGALRDHELAGSAFGLWTGAVGLGGFVAAILTPALSVTGTALLSTGNATTRAATGLVVGALIWVVYWIRSVHHAPRTMHWHVYVMLAGVAAGLVVAIASLSSIAYDVLVWFFGTPATTDAAAHFQGSISACGALFAGGLVWWYHRAVLNESETSERNEAQRVYEYVVSVIALAAASVGVMILLVAFLESLTASALIAGDSAGNTLLMAATLLVVGGPLWWWFWRRIQAATEANPEVERASATRRVYLFLLFGIVGVAALIALLVSVYQLFVDLVAGTFGSSTVRSMRWGLGLLVTAAAVASYHWRIYRAERDATPVVPSVRVTLVGATDHANVSQLRQRPGLHLDLWLRTDGSAPFDPIAVEAALDAITGADVEQWLLVADGSTVQVLPVERR